ncbi:hypothetical protein [Shinella zoogloeoides]|uniref:hypothetical protein n=1 Tax=Shinella zoogloeoides TaxID=352475 RepID=UPI001F5943D8|nr:hypothetical protein [Shinella zoogloeoides]
MSNVSPHAHDALQAFIGFIKQHEYSVRRMFVKDLTTGHEADVAAWFLDYERNAAREKGYWSGLTDQAFAATLKEWAGGRDCDVLRYFLDIDEFDEEQDTEPKAMSLEAAASGIEILRGQVDQMDDSLCFLLSSEASMAFEESVSNRIVGDEAMREFSASLTRLCRALNDIQRRTGCLLTAISDVQQAREAA